MNRYAISRNIKQALNDLGMSQRRLSEQTGLSEVTLSRYMNGIRQPTAYSLYRIALALKVPVESLMDGVDDGNPTGCPLSKYYEPPTYIVENPNKRCESEYDMEKGNTSTARNER